MMGQDLFHEICHYVRQSRPTALTKEERLDILRLHAHYRLQGVAGASEKISEALGRSLRVVKQVWSDYLRTRQVQVAVPPANHATRATRLPRSKFVLSEVQEFVRNRRLTRTRTVASDILDFMFQNGYIHLDFSCKKTVAACERNVQRYLVREGFKRGKRTNLGYKYALSEKNEVARDLYVERAMKMMYDDNEKRTMVYLDESYIHHHYSRHHDTLYHPDDLLDKHVKEYHKARVGHFEGGKTQLTSMLLSLDVVAHINSLPNDYHAMFDSKYFVQWFAILLSELRRNNIQRACIVLDNASYHKSLPEGTPRKSNKKVDLQAACVKYGIDFSYAESKSVL
ncbi:unnamed protein product [Aphanomyces euteiches]